MHEFGLAYTPGTKARRSARPLVRAVLFLALPLLYYVHVVHAFFAADARLLELQGEIDGRGAAAERAEKLLKRMATSVPEDAPLLPAELFAPRTAETSLLPLPAGTGEAALAAAGARTAEVAFPAEEPSLGRHTWPANAHRAERYAEAALLALRARVAREQGVRPLLSAFRGFPEISAGGVHLSAFAVERSADLRRRVAFTVSAAGYAPIRALIERMEADPRFSGVTVGAFVRDGERRVAELVAALAEGGAR